MRRFFALGTHRQIPKGGKNVSKTAKAFINLVIAGACVVFMLISANIVFGWFSDNRVTRAEGISVSVKSTIEVRATRDGQDIGVLEPSPDMERLPNSRTDSIRPGSSGYFDFYVYNPSAASYAFTFDLSVSNNEFRDNEGYFPGNISDEIKATALRYVNAHIMFFTDRSDDGIYSGRIAPGESVRQEVTGTSPEPYAVRIYWVWIPWYSDIFTPGSTVLTESERAEIAAYYTSGEQALSEMFNGGTADEQSFNEADYVIGTTIRYLCFCLNVQGE